MKKEKQVLQTADRMPGSQIPPEGLEMIFQSLYTEESEKGKRFVMSGTSKGRETEVVFFSKKLYNLLAKWEKDLRGKRIIITGKGEGVHRDYEIEVG